MTSLNRQLTSPGCSLTDETTISCDSDNEENRHDKNEPTMQRSPNFRSSLRDSLRSSLRRNKSDPDFFSDTSHRAIDKLRQMVQEKAKSHDSRERFNRRLTSFAQHTTLHGLEHAVESRTRWAKYFWITVLVIVVVLVSLQLHKLLCYFMENPTVTSINVIYPENGLQFPSLTVCILSKLNRTALREKYPNMPKVLAEFSMASFISPYSTALMDIGYFWRQGMWADDLQKELEQHLNGTKILKFVEDTSFHCRGQFLLCWFENGHIFDCCDPNQPLRVKRYLLHSGPCFEFQTETLKQRLPGPVGGFGFAYWYPNNDLFPSVFNSYDEHAVHLYTSPTEAMLEMNPIVLPVGSHVHISLQATKHTRLAYDQLGRPTCFHRELKYFNNYTYASCQAECQIDTMLNLCNCTGVTTYGRIPQDRVCSPKKSLYCYKELAYSFTDLGEECRRINCTEACTYWSYKATQTVGKVFNPILKEKMVDYWRLPNNSDPKLSLIFADIYFTDIEYTDIQQMPAFNIETFISSIGGAMGLWTGASIVTWIHLMYFCIACLCHHKKEMRDRSRNLSRLVSEEVEHKLAIRLDQRITEKQAFLGQMQNGCVEGKD